FLGERFFHQWVDRARSDLLKDEVLGSLMILGSHPIDRVPKDSGVMAKGGIAKNRRAVRINRGIPRPISGERAAAPVPVFGLLFEPRLVSQVVEACQRGDVRFLLYQVLDFEIGIPSVCTPTPPLPRSRRSIPPPGSGGACAQLALRRGPRLEQSPQ